MNIWETVSAIGRPSLAARIASIHSLRSSSLLAQTTKSLPNSSLVLMQKANSTNGSLEHQMHTAVLVGGWLNRDDRVQRDLSLNFVFLCRLELLVESYLHIRQFRGCEHKKTTLDCFVDVTLKDNINKPKRKRLACLLQKLSLFQTVSSNIGIHRLGLVMYNAKNKI